MLLLAIIYVIAVYAIGLFVLSKADKKIADICERAKRKVDEVCVWWLGKRSEEYKKSKSEKGE